jgi:alkylhydroperoxidase family enzyme
VSRGRTRRCGKIGAVTEGPATPRIAPLELDELTDEQRELLSAGGELRNLHIFRTLVRHPKLYRRWSPFGGFLLQRSSLEPRDRELVILRTAYRCGSDYEWGQHVRIGRDAGLTDEEIRRVADGPAAPGWSSDDATLLRAVDELHGEHRLSDDIWSQLRGRFDDATLIELTMLSGHYALLAGVLNSLGVQPEGPLPALGET